jgi:pyruvate dehydrogenase E1 component alpha subunit
MAKTKTNISQASMAKNDSFDPAIKLAIYERMLLLRRAEDCLVRNFKDGILPANVHLYIGQEAVAVGVCAHLSDRDWITSTHRGHGHYLAKGGDPEGLFAEIYGRVGGICKGFGGTMHVADFSKGIVGANGIVGAGIPIATGAALSAQIENDGRVAVAFFGDGASNRGVFMEALNIAALWRLPMLFICENNGFCEFSPTDTVTSGTIHARGTALGVPSQVIDGNDVEIVWRAAGEAIAHARNGGGPSLIEAQTYRLRGHAEAEIHWLSEPYRTQEEIERWSARDPLSLFADRLKRDGVSNAELSAIEAAVAKRIDEAALAASKSEPPSPDLLRPFLEIGDTATMESA